MRKYVYDCFFGVLIFACLPAHAQDLAQIGQQKPVTFHGGVDVRLVAYKANGIPARYLPFNYLVSGSPVLSLYGVQVPFYFSFSRQQNSYTQPFNQFGLSPTYKWITVHAGYRNLSYSPFTLAGHTFLGAGADLRPGKWRLGAMYGRFNKATVVDTLQGLYFENFSYRRTGYSAKVGYGTDQSYFDIIMLNAKDDPASAPAGQRAFLDSMKITPASNLVTGYQTRLTFLDNRLVFESDGALSLYTTDTRLGPIEDSTIRRDIRFFEKFTTVNYSSELYAAFQASVQYKLKYMSLKVQYRYVEGGYKSMGAYFLNNDLENWTINPTFLARRGTIRFNGSLGFQRDNLQELKRATSRRVIGAANLSADFNEQWGLDLSYANFSNTQRASTVRFADSLRIAQSTQNLSISPRFLKVSATRSHSVVVSANYNQFKELNASRTLAETGNDIITQTYFVTYQLGFLASKSSLFGTANYAKLGNDVINDQNTGLTLGGSKTFNSKLMLTASSSYLWSNRNGALGHILNESLQLRYTLKSRHSFQCMAVFIGNYPDTPSEFQRRFNEIRTELGYSLNF
jgi:hypothetical protein